MAAGKTETVSVNLSGDIPQYLLIREAASGAYSGGALKAVINCRLNANCARSSTPRALLFAKAQRSWVSGLIWRADRRGSLRPERLWLDPTQNTSRQALRREQGGAKPRYPGGVLTTVPVEVMEPLRKHQPFDQIYLLTRLRYADGRAIVLLRKPLFARPHVPELLRVRSLNGSLTEVYESHYNLVIPACICRSTPPPCLRRPHRRWELWKDARLLLRRLNFLINTGECWIWISNTGVTTACVLRVDTRSECAGCWLRDYPAYQSYRLTAIG